MLVISASFLARFSVLVWSRRSSVYLQRLIFRGGSAAPLQADHLSDLDDGEGDGDPRGAGEHPGRLHRVLLVLLVLRLLEEQRRGRAGRDRAVHGALVLVLNQVDGGDGDGAGRNWDVLRQDLVL